MTERVCEAIVYDRAQGAWRQCHNATGEGRLCALHKRLRAAVGVVQGDPQ